MVQMVDLVQLQEFFLYYHHIIHEILLVATLKNYHYKFYGGFLCQDIQVQVGNVQED